MNIVNQLTWRLLRKNKRRTLVTMIGVIISVAMLTAVASISVSFIDLLKRQTIADDGEWHVLYKDVTPDQIEAIEKDGNTKTLSLSKELGYAYLEGSKNENKPYLFVKQYNKEGFKQFPITLADGRLPENDGEVVISDHIAENAGVSYSIGDVLTLEIGDRITDDPEMPQMDQQFSFQVDEHGEPEEQIEHTTEKEFTIVGIIKRPTWEPVWAPGYTVITYLDGEQLAANETVNAAVALKKIGNSIYKDTEKFAAANHIGAYQLNDNLLRYYGVMNNDNLRVTLYSLTSIIMAIIIAASVSLIYNAFAISVADRSKYLGMLASVGATRKQKRNSVFFEGLIISLISIPLGILAGLSGIGITFVFINKLIQDAFWTTETFKLVVTPGSILVAVVVSLLTVFISTYIPARKASKMTAIDAIRQVEDIKLTNKKVKTSKFIRKIFGMEAEIGLKNLKRNKRSYQATVFSIVISIVLFLSVTYFTDNMKKSVELTQNTYNYDMSIMLGYDDDEQFVHSVKDLADVTESNVMIQVDDLKTGVVEAETVTENHSVEDENGKYYYINLNVLDDVNLVAYAKKVGIDSKGLLEQPQAILVDTVSFYDPDTNRYTTSKIIHTKAGEKLDVEYMDWENEQDIYLDQLEIAAVTDEIPLGMQPGNPAYLNIFISENTFEQLGEGEALDLPHAKYLYVNSDDPIKTQKDIEEVEDFKHAINNDYQNNQSDKQLILLLSVFIYGFIVLIIAISIANILNTISTSITLRTREFAMLKSVGMTPEGFNKMIHYESIFYGIKALLYGLPLSIGTMLLMYKSFSGSFSYSFTLPWLQILYTIIAVFIIVGISMGHASSKVKKENIIDALKQDNI